jgi:cytochrome P450
MTIPAGVNLQTSIAAVGRDPDLWEDPERYTTISSFIFYFRFWPERWEKNIPSEQFMPFFYGPRFW